MASTERAARPAGRRIPQTPIVLVDKNAVFRAGLEAILAGSRFRVVASCASLADLSNRANSIKPGLALVGLDGQDMLESLVSWIGRGTRVVVLSEKFNAEEVFAAIEAGVNGYLVKNEVNAPVLLTSLDLARLGGVAIPHGFATLKDDVRLTRLANATAPVTEVNQLSNRERSILKLLTEGASNKQIARNLEIAEATVKVHVMGLLRKIRVSNRTQAAMWAIQHLPGPGTGSLIGDEQNDTAEPSNPVNGHSTK